MKGTFQSFVRKFNENKIPQTQFGSKDTVFSNIIVNFGCDKKIYCTVLSALRTAVNLRFLPVT